MMVGTMDGEMTDQDVRALVAEAKYRAIVRRLIDSGQVRPVGDALPAWLQEVTDQAMGMMTEDDLEALAHLIPPGGPDS